MGKIVFPKIENADIHADVKAIADIVHSLKNISELDSAERYTDELDRFK
jgi:hypothetical protein